MAALLRTLAGSGENVQGTAAPVHSSLCSNATPVEHRSIMGRGFTRAVAHAPHLNSGKEPRVRYETRPVCEGPDRFRVPLPRCLVGTSWLEPETPHTGGFRIRLSLQGPACRPAFRRWFEPDLLIEDLRGFRDTDLADDQARVVRSDPNLAVVAATERANDVAEVIGILHFADRKRLHKPLGHPTLVPAQEHVGSYEAQSTFSTSRCSSSGPLRPTASSGPPRFRPKFVCASSLGKTLRMTRSPFSPLATIVSGAAKRSPNSRCQVRRPAPTLGRDHLHRPRIES